MTRGPLAILCSGQGGQHRGMFDLVAAVEAAEPVFRAAAGLLGEDPRSFVRTRDEAALFEGLAGQILCCTQALAMWSALRPVLPRRCVIAGYSVGELAAWGCAGIFDPRRTLDLAAARAAAMAAAAPEGAGLAGIVGLRGEAVAAIVGRHGAYCAIVNDLDSFVVGGSAAALDACCREAEAAGARRVVRLKVAVPSHTPLLAAAVDPFRQALGQATAQPLPPGLRLLSGIDGESVSDLDAGLDKLARQIRTPLAWRSCLESCRAAGAELALELGPGNALARMAAPLFPEGACRSVDEFRTIEGVQGWLRRGLAE